MSWRWALTVVLCSITLCTFFSAVVVAGIRGTSPIERFSESEITHVNRPKIPLPTPTVLSRNTLRTLEVTDLRQGPGAAFAIIGLIQRNATVTVVGRDESGDWLAVTMQGMVGVE